jgi:hypothetical protein
VLPERGALGYPWGSGLSVPILAAYALTQGALLTAGVGLLGLRALRSSVAPLLALGLGLSVALMLFRWDQSSWWGLSIDAVLAGAFIAARNLRLLEDDRPSQDGVAAFHHGAAG